MQLRGLSHVLFSRTEILQRIRRPDCVEVLTQLMELYEVRERRMCFKREGAGLDGIERIETDTFLELMRLTGVWMQQPVVVDFGGRHERENKQNQHADADGQGSGSEIHMSKAERRRRRRQRRKGGVNGVLRGTQGNLAL